MAIRYRRELSSCLNCLGIGYLPVNPLDAFAKLENKSNDRKTCNKCNGRGRIYQDVGTFKKNMSDLDLRKKQKEFQDENQIKLF
jgi:hypothetical protein